MSSGNEQKEGVNESERESRMRREAVVKKRGSGGEAR